MLVGVRGCAGEPRVAGRAVEPLFAFSAADLEIDLPKQGSVDHVVEQLAGVSGAPVVVVVLLEEKDIHCPKVDVMAFSFRGTQHRRGCLFDSHYAPIWKVQGFQ